MRHKSKKVKEAEKWVDDYISEHREPPTYDVLADGIGISKTAAYARCAKFRSKMKLDEHTKTKMDRVVKMRLSFVIPNDRFAEFSEMLTELEDFLEK